MRLAALVQKGALIAGLALGAMTLAPKDAWSDEAQPGGATGAEEREVEIRKEQALIIVRGQGRISVSPDSLRVTLGVEAQETTLAAARTKVNQRMEAMINALKALGIPELSLKTSYLQYNPVYERPKVGIDQSGSQKLIGYRASNQITATLLERPVDELGARAATIVDTALDAGANTIQNISFFLNDEGNAQIHAIELAVQDAERIAKAMAKVAGVGITGLVSMEVGSTGRGDVFGEAVPKSAYRTPTLEVGDIEIVRTVTVRFAFAPSP